jgi:hypothetical protein
MNLKGRTRAEIKQYINFCICITLDKWRMQMILGKLSAEFVPSAIKIQALLRGNHARWRIPCFSWKE